MLDSDMTLCAQYHCDKHIVKMPTEAAQLISSVLHKLGKPELAPYKLTHENHPCAVWARKHLGNFQRLLDYAHAISAEYTVRYGKVHKAFTAIEGITYDTFTPADFGDTSVIHSPMPNCTTFKNLPAHYNLIDAYRMYYIRDKQHILDFKTERPDWLDQYADAIEECELLGNAPASTEVKPKRKTKASILKELETNHPGLTLPSMEKRTLADLSSLALWAVSAEFAPEPCEGRLKAPYLEAMISCTSGIVTFDLNKFTIAELKHLLGWANEKVIAQ